MRASLSNLVVALAWLVACTPATATQIGVRPTDLRAHAAELNQNAMAQIETVTRRGGKVTSGSVETVLLAQSVTLAGHPTTIDALLAACEPMSPRCALLERDGELIVLRVIERAEGSGSGKLPGSGERKTNAHNPPVALVSGVLSVVSFVVMIACLVDCSDGNRRWAWLPAGTGGLLGLISALTAGGRD